MTSLIAALLWATATPEAPPLPEIRNPVYGVNTELAAYIEEGVANHPELESLHYQWLAALERIPQARALDDPMLMFGQMVSANNVPTMIEIEQRLPWFGTRQARADVAAAEADTRLQAFIAVRNTRIAAIKAAYFDYALLGDEIDIVQVQRMFLDYVRDIVELRLGLGLATDDELLRIDTERILLEDRQASLEQEAPAIRASLNKAMGAPADTPRDIPRDTPFPPDPPPLPDMIARIDANNPNLEALTMLAEMREREQERARAGGRPMITVGLEYRRVRRSGPVPDDYPGVRLRDRMNPALRDRADETTESAPIDPSVFRGGMNDENMRDWELRVGLSLPIYRKKTRAAVREARYLERSAILEREALRLDLEAEAQTLYARLEDARRTHRLYGETLVPLALDTYESLQNSYSAGLERASFLDLLGAIRQVLDFQLDQARAAARWQQAITELEVLAGGGWHYTTPETTPETLPDPTVDITPLPSPKDIQAHTDMHVIDAEPAETRTAPPDTPAAPQE